MLPSHCHDYNNLTLMYRPDDTSPFVPAESVETHKLFWKFERDKCYIFTNHFCGFLLNQNDRPEEKITLDAIMLAKFDQDLLYLKLTFGCYNQKSKCSIPEVCKVNII